MIALVPIIVLVLVACLIALIALPGGALIAIPLILVIGLALGASMLRGPSAGRRRRPPVTDEEPGEAIGRAATPPASSPPDRGRERIQG